MGETFSVGRFPIPSAHLITNKRNYPLNLEFWDMPDIYGQKTRTEQTKRFPKLEIAANQGFGWWSQGGLNP
jgi:hypothetical protein